MADPDALFRRFIPIRDLPAAARAPRDIAANDEERARIAEEFGLLSLEKLTATYTLRPAGEDGWRLEGRVDAVFEQACVVTLDPAPGVICETFARVFERGAPDPFAEPGDVDVSFDMDFDADDPPEALGDGIDPGAAALETFSLALDPYPRAPGAAFAAVSARPKGAEPLDTETRKPFAALAALRKTMDKDG